MKQAVLYFSLFYLLLFSQAFTQELADRKSQFTLFDVEFSYSKSDADNSSPSKSNFYVKNDLINPNRPVDWTSPVNFRDGLVHIRIDVIEKPMGNESTK
ncbi:hypothetical protein [Jiulongibacter sediminis]|uniref:hypothetical protein n=1 Tax=Jiulongibacter sediminis TaxID=1605367 RepID=UPI0026F187FB|nr:hypothetical protein [Jiulongibacter sediminis]